MAILGINSIGLAPPARVLSGRRLLSQKDLPKKSITPAIKKSKLGASTALNLSQAANGLIGVKEVPGHDIRPHASLSAHVKGPFYHSSAENGDDFSLRNLFQPATTQHVLSEDVMDQSPKGKKHLLGKASFDNVIQQDARNVQKPSTQLLQDFFVAGKFIAPKAGSVAGSVNADELSQMHQKIHQGFLIKGTPLSDRNWGNLYSGDQRLHRFVFDAFGLGRHHPMIHIPYGMSRTVQPGGQAIYRAPLMGNQVPEFDFAVSPERIMGIGILAAWRLLGNWTADRFGHRHVRIFGSEVRARLISPIYSDFAALSEDPDSDQFDQVQRHLLNFGQKMVAVTSKVYDSNDQVVAELTVEFVIELSQSGQQKAAETQIEQTAMGQERPLLSSGKRPSLSLNKLLKSLINRH